MLPTLWYQDTLYPSEWMESEIRRILAGLHALDCGPGDTVAAMLRNSPQYVALTLACRRAGLYLASVNWHFKALEAEHILTDSSARALFVDADLLEQIAGGIPGHVAVVTVAGNAAAAPAHAQDWTAFGAGLPPMPARAGLVHSAITYTSGTTGKPKGVRRIPPAPGDFASAERFAQVMDIVYGRGDVAFLAAPIYHSAAMSYLGHFSNLGATLVLEPRFDAARTLALIEKHRITHAYLVPTMYQRLLALPPEARARHDISSLRQVASTGSPCPAPLKQAMIDWFGPIITEAYGSSEAGYTTFIDSADWQRHPGSAGRAMPDADVRILDEGGGALPAGEIGLIHVRQRALSDFTYVNRPEARAAIERDGLVTLGDMGYLDEEGFLYICDRKADMIISGGVNIYPAEIESVLHTMPGVADCAVFGIPDAEFGEALAAAVQPLPGAQVDAAAVQSFLRERIANYKVPRIVDIHQQLPREDTGKIFKRKLRDPYWQGQARAI
ncbi:AMP-binding protein [Noviherbaspirillum suwonense]|uniref:Long-chain acyl-CoA synthetase n=1 Tax=Noviherbaspirillum suwonense TaxID=1224511 RepID=A0ABY1Q065_9BURK|nr:AMP-binding protein [Noviherbaspirillum suwonense]SMP51256.1 long-chain acyl-CoA synthetase [Noviherbaspirillum suwonense]